MSGIEFMGRWPISSNASIVDCNKDVDPNPSNGCCIAPDCLVEGSYANVNYDDCKATIRCYFEKILWVFLKEIGRRGSIRPVAALLGEGGSLDLFELFMVVRDKGGYQVVSEKELWSSVVLELGLDLGLSASVKLIYSKYLSDLEKWLMVRSGGTKLENGNSDYHYRKSFPFLSELEAKVKCMLYDECSGFKSNKPNGNVNVATAALEKEIKFPKLKKEEHDLHGDVTPIQQNCTETPRDNGETDQIHVIEDCRSLAAVNIETELDTHGRYRESLLRMLKWARKTAKHPGNPSNCTVPGASKWKAYASDDALWLQVIRAKDALLTRKDVDRIAEKRLLIQKKTRMHPSIYEDNIDNHQLSTERICCSKKSNASACNNSHPTIQSNCISSLTTEIGKGLENQALSNGDLPSKMEDNQPNEDSVEKPVPTGALFQAVIPEWTGNISDSDSKWLGTQSWPSQHGNINSVVSDKNPIGKGRPDSCSCQFPGSVECFRFHIAEARMGLKLELGLTFYDWRFHHMGEEISLQWTAEEEKRFKELAVSSFNNQSRCFWNYSLKWFPMKSRKNLISYYFNVFLLRQRSYQNRATPNSIDSDDEDLEFGCISGDFGAKAMEILGSKSVECAENRQFTDVE
ncbi:AT-rich interactive domain-containing protein 2 [Benincasa hispida]|uniref:AT-rich interactive domain-containing protein 2 n=1 Tax=Benincasa hispida TaxID=102211 RepID=UPI001902A9EB|nr:AT-rich interactive domain-containing protein 2 [Benincasa hispida]